ncbi:hypothetical protein ACOSOMT5_P3061 [Acidiphilium sp. MT5]
MTNTLSTSISIGISLSSTGAYQTPFTITSTGTVAPTTAAYGISGTIGVYGTAASGLTLINQGVVNGGTGGISGGAGGSGVDLLGVSSFSNSGDITGGFGGFDDAGTGGTGGTGVDLSGAGSFGNSGNITGGSGGYAYDVGGAGGSGVDLSGGGTFSNSGTITGGNGGSFQFPGIVGAGGVGVLLNGGTLLNSGLISGGASGSGVQTDAVYFGTNASTLIVEAGATFTGHVVANSTISDVLAIGGSARVYLSSLGTEYQNFRSLAFDPGATGTFAGSYTALSNDSITGFARGDGLYLNGFTARSEITTIGTGGILAIAGNTTGQTLNLTFAAAAIGDVLDLITGTNGTAITFDPHFLNQSISTGISLATTGTYQTPFTITSQGHVAPTAAVVGASGTIGIYGSAASGLTLINQGVVNGGTGGTGSGAGGGAGGTGVDLSGVGSFSNSGAITGGSGGYAYDLGGAGGIGLDPSGGGTFSNSGTITGGNGGRIEFGGTGGTGGVGVDPSGRGTFSNSGTITGGNGGGNGLGGGGAGGTGGAGVDLSGTGSFSNSGAITGGTGGFGSLSLGSGGIGISLSGGTLVNSGLIAGTQGADAVQFGTNTSTLIVESGATFTGNVVANNTVSDVLAIGGSAPVTISNIGAGYLNFSTLAFEPGATGTFEGSLAALSNDSIIGFARGDSLYLTGFAVNTTATIGAGGIFAIAGNGGQTLNLTFASAAIGDVLDLTTGANGTGVTFDPHFLNQSIATGIILTPTGTYQAPFTITSNGAVTPGTSSGNGANGVYGAVFGQIVHNYGYVRGGAGANGAYEPGFPAFDTNGSLGGAGVDLVSGSNMNAGTIGGGGGGIAYGPSAQQGGLAGAGGVGVSLSGAATLTNSGTISGGTGGPNFKGIVSYFGAGGAGISVNGGTILNSDLIEGGFSDSGVRADAVQFGYTASTIIVEHGATFTGSVVANSTVSDVLAIGGSTPVTLSNIGAEYQNFRSLAFETGSSGIVSGTYTAMDNQSLTNIAGFAQGDTLILNGFAATSDTYVSGTGLELSNGTSQITLDITGNFSTANFNVIDPPANTTISLNPPCFAQGTRILTTRGEIPVEQLRANDHAILHTGGTAPIQWIGHRSLSLLRHPNPAQVNPIRIRAGALDNDVPSRDLFLSPDHALYLNGALIPAKSLLNGSTIRQESRRTITYYHIELPHHAVLYAEGTPAESYLETGNRSAFENGGGGAITLHPDFAQTLREQTSCSPFAESGPIVEQTRTQILARTHQPLTNDPALTLQPNQDGSVTIHSRRAIPGYFSPDPRDQRTLGVKILSLHAGSREINLDHPLLTEGWHTPEPDGRWTNGSGLIPAALAQHGPITIKLAATTQYPKPQLTRVHAQGNERAWR